MWIKRRYKKGINMIYKKGIRSDINIGIGRDRYNYGGYIYRPTPLINSG